MSVNTDPTNGDVVIAGMGELHLEIILDRLKREFSLEASVGRPQVAYKETLTRQADGEGRLVRQSGGRGQYAHAKVHLFPGEPGSGYVFEDATIGGVIPPDFIKPILSKTHHSDTGGRSPAVLLICVVGSIPTQLTVDSKGLSDHRPPDSWRSWIKRAATKFCGAGDGVVARMSPSPGRLPAGGQPAASQRWFTWPP